MEFIESIMNFFTQMITLLWSIVDTIISTRNMIDDVDFKNSEITKYIGYVKYITGDVLFGLLWTCCAIPVGVYLFSFTLRAYELVKDLTK